MESRHSPGARQRTSSRRGSASGLERLFSIFFLDIAGGQSYYNEPFYRKIYSSLKTRFPTNWELSTARATQVVKYLQEDGGLDPALLSATGYSEYQPVAPNDTDEGRRKNRRIEIVLLPLAQ